MSGRFPFATFADRLTPDRRHVFAAFAGSKRADTVLAHIRSQGGFAVPRAAPLKSWRELL